MLFVLLALLSVMESKLIINPSLNLHWVLLRDNSVVKSLYNFCQSMSRGTVQKLNIYQIWHEISGVMGQLYRRII